jgi:hypothetical protein
VSISPISPVLGALTMNVALTRDRYCAGSILLGRFPLLAIRMTCQRRFRITPITIRRHGLRDCGIRRRLPSSFIFIVDSCRWDTSGGACDDISDVQTSENARSESRHVAKDHHLRRRHDRRERSQVVKVHRQRRVDSDQDKLAVVVIQAHSESGFERQADINQHSAQYQGKEIGRQFSEYVGVRLDLHNRADGVSLNRSFGICSTGILEVWVRMPRQNSSICSTPTSPPSRKFP